MTPSKFSPESPAIDTPCIKVCVMDDATDLCAGCGRTRAEIASWTSLSGAERRQIMLELPRRLKSPEAR